MHNNGDGFMAPKVFSLEPVTQLVNHVPVASVGVVPVGEEVVKERIPLSCGPTSPD